MRHGRMSVTPLVAACGPLLLLLLGAAAVEGDSLRPIEHKEGAWSEVVASSETHEDVANLLLEYDAARPKLQATLDAFKLTRVKDVQELDPSLSDFRSISVWGHALADLYEMPGHSYQEEIYARMLEVATQLVSAQKTEVAYVEGREIRGWPMYVDTRDSKPTFEAYQFGWLGRSVGLAARAAAERGDHETAVGLLEPVLWYMYDGFLTDDKERSRLDTENRVVYVPDEASDGRKERHIEVAAGTQRICVTKPQAYNKSFNVARAAMAVIRAIDAIDWEQQPWTMTEWTIGEARESMATMITDIGQWFRDAFQDPPKTGRDDRDNYPGPDGTKWVVWHYRDYSSCPEYQGTRKDRLEDIDHATEDIAFLADYRSFAAEAHDGVDVGRRGGGDMFPKSLVHKMVVTFLNRIVADYGAPAADRFSCDVAGVNDGDEWGDPEKQCNNARSRELGLRPRSAIGWLPLVISVQDELADADDLRCDAMRMVNTLLPMALPGDDFEPKKFDTLSPMWAPDAIRAKYYFYNFEQELSSGDCYGNK